MKMSSPWRSLCNMVGRSFEGVRCVPRAVRDKEEGAETLHHPRPRLTFNQDPSGPPTFSLRVRHGRLRAVLPAVLELHERLDRGVNLKIHLRLARDERAPARAAAAQVERQARGVRVVA